MENILQHPSALIDAGDVHIIRTKAAEAEQLGMLHPEQLKIIYRQKWFKLLVPEVYTGRQVSLSQLVRLQEAISWADGSTGWVVTLCSGAGWFGGFINPEIAQRIFVEDTVSLAGSGAVCGTAEITSNGYIINGTWKYASGAHHATHITANCSIIKDGKPVLNDDGEPLVLPFIFDKKDVTILPAWKYIGMVATGSDSFEVKELTVPFNRQFKIDPAAAVINSPLYQYPFLQMAEATIAVNLSGIAIHFIDLCEGIFREKLKQPRLTDEQKEFLTDELNHSKSELDLVREDFFETVDQSWNAIQSNNIVPQDILQQVSITSRKLAHFSREIVDRLYPLCGLTAASTETEINRAWRDLHTASQHALITFAG
ncbi:acyl-CoA dehydrogenase [Mucilaginibacter sp. BJC16-A38]|uniref:acyl-CoA dehydrogenase n=1 Tax=Mucilaginibacter phenanthrenivorans TaxID=1234842 RepID=UPI0021571E0F|nr:acyl-CoA dehydrogenase [Mucilaginibacter phenanthrenivorans]MCR8561507.1 acyl-CoA dehydrogenase [Mucilaginibacter phenanthrenivorans]